MDEIIRAQALEYHRLPKPGKIAVTPDSVETIEIGSMVPGPSFVFPETNRHHRKTTRANQFAFLATNRMSGIVKYLDRHAQASALDFAPINRSVGIANHEAGNDVRTAGYRGEL